MFLFAKIITAFITPPGLFFSLLLLVLILFRLKKPKPARLVLIGSLVLMYLFSTEVIRDLLLLPIENACPVFNAVPEAEPAEPAEPAADYIVVLGGGIVEHSPEEGGRATIAPDPLKRLIYAYTLYRQLQIPLIVAGGRVLRGQEIESEAETAVRLLTRLGVPAGDILPEDQSRNTWENARNVRNLYQPKRVLLVTSAYHMPRSLLCFARAGVTCIPAPTDYKVGRSGYIITSFLPGMGAFAHSFTALKEYIGLLYSWFTLPQLPPVAVPQPEAMQAEATQPEVPQLEAPQLEAPQAEVPQS